MNRKFEDVFQECLERIQQGDTIENCLRSYPAIAADLEILLRATLNLNWQASRIQPRPEFKARARDEFIRAQKHAAYSKEGMFKEYLLSFVETARGWKDRLNRKDIFQGYFHSIVETAQDWKHRLDRKDMFRECLRDIIEMAGVWKDRLNRKDISQECLRSIVETARGWKDRLNRKDIFQECLERVQQGDIIENCLQRYPAIAADLEIMLRAALNLSWRVSRMQPRPEFKARARAEFIHLQYQLAYDKYLASTRPTIFSLHRAWAPALAVVLILVLSSVGTVAASSNAMPDQTLYSVKIATEQVQLSLASSDQAKAELNMKFAEIRTQEIATMATEGKSDQVIIATEKLEQHLAAAEQAVQRFESGSSPAFSTSEPAMTRPAPMTSTEPPSPQGSQPEPAPAQVQQTPPEQTNKAEPSPAPEPAPAATTDNQVKPENQTSVEGKTDDQNQSNEKEQSVEKLKKSLQETNSRNIAALEEARKKSPEKSKEAIQKAIDISKGKNFDPEEENSESENSQNKNQPNSSVSKPKNTTVVPSGADVSDSTKKQQGQKGPDNNNGNEEKKSSK